jgi:hypothetical protein
MDKTEPDWAEREATRYLRLSEQAEQQNQFPEMLARINGLQAKVERVEAREAEQRGYERGIEAAAKIANQEAKKWIGFTMVEMTANQIADAIRALTAKEPHEQE